VTRTSSGTEGLAPQGVLRDRDQRIDDPLARYAARSACISGVAQGLPGQARTSRGHDWRHYTCPVSEERTSIFRPDGQQIICPAKSVAAERAEAAVLSAVGRLSPPEEAIREARQELRRRLREPVSSVADRERSR
jgi:hypothetical protein